MRRGGMQFTSARSRRHCIKYSSTCASRCASTTCLHRDQILTRDSRNSPSGLASSLSLLKKATTHASLTVPGELGRNGSVSSDGVGYGVVHELCSGSDSACFA